MFTSLKLLNIIMFYIAGRIYNVKRQKKKAPAVEEVPAPDTEAKN